MTRAAGPVPVEGVDDQAESAEEQDLRHRLAVGGPAGELLRQGQGEDEGGERSPARPDEPGGQAAEGEHPARPEHRAASSAAVTPPAQNAGARIIGSPAMNCGTMVRPTW